MGLEDIYFKINQDIINKFQNCNNDYEIENPEISFCSKFLPIFDKNNDGKFNPNEIKNIFENVLSHTEPLGDGFVLNEKTANKIIEQTPELKNNNINKRDFVFFIQELFSSIPTTYSSEDKKIPNSYYPNGNIETEYRENETISYYEDGTIKNSINTKTNETVFYYPNGKIKTNDKNEVSTSYYISGEVYEVKNSDTSLTRYYKNGNIKEKHEINGNRAEYYENGQIKYQLENRYEKSYYENGQLKSSNIPDDNHIYIKYYLNGQVQEIISKDYTITHYDENGNVIQNPDKSDSDKLPDRLDKDNILEVLEKVSLEKYSKEYKIDENEIENILKEIYEDGLNNLSIKTQVTNKYHTGDSYDVSWEDDKIYITNLNTNRKSVIDTQSLIKNFPKNQQYLFLIRLQSMPAEVLEDMSIEALYNSNKVGNNTNGLFCPNTDSMSLNNGTFSTDTIVHELGHAVDHIFENRKYLSERTEIFSSFEEEKLTNNVHSDRNKNYCATNVNEFFAEAYTLIMLGEEYHAQESIETNFPKTFALVKDLLNEIRTLPDETRHRQDLNTKV